MKIRTLVLAIALAGGALAMVTGTMVTAAQAQVAPADGITYQGRLEQNGQPFTGTVDLEFKVFTTGIGDQQVGSTISLEDWPVEDGLFQAELDIGDVYRPVVNEEGRGLRWLEVSVDGTVLNPRQKIASAPRALRAVTAERANLPWRQGILSDTIFYGEGNVGIDTTIPRQQLSIGANLDLYSGGVNNPARPSIRASGADNMVVSAIDSGATYINHDGGSGGVRFHNGTSGGELMRLTGGGRLGIGTAGPQAPLHVVEPGNNRAIRAENNGDNTATIWAINHDSGWGLFVEGAPGSRNYFQRPVGIGTSSPRQQLSIGNALDLYSGQPNNPAQPSIRGFGGGNLYLNGAPGEAVIVNADNGSGSFRVNNGNPGQQNTVMLVTGGGRVGIGVNTPSSRLHVGGVVQADRLEQDFWAAADGAALCRFQGVLGWDNRFGMCSSSARYKQDIAGLEDVSLLIDALRPVRFKWIENGKEDIGLIAEEVAEVLPELATYADDGQVQGVNYRHMVAVLIKAMQERRQLVDSALAERDAEIAVLHAELVALQDLAGHNAELEARMAVLEAAMLDGNARVGRVQ